MEISIYSYKTTNESFNFRLHREALEMLKKEFDGEHLILFEEDERAYLREVDIDDKHPLKFTNGNFCFKYSYAPSLTTGKYKLEEVESKLFEIKKLSEDEEI
jgi:hypothetical protein